MDNENKVTGELRNRQINTESNWSHADLRAWSIETEIQTKKLLIL